MRALPTTAITLLGVLFLPSASKSQYVRDLGAEQWTLSSAALNRTVPAQFPSQVHMDLLREGIIGEIMVSLICQLVSGLRFADCVECLQMNRKC